MLIYLEKLFLLIYIFIFIDYYKLNRLQKALALQKFSLGQQAVRKNPHHRRVPRHVLQQQQQQQQVVFPPAFSTSPPTPTPMNIDQLAPFYDDPALFTRGTALSNGRVSKY